jgi:hypothetical protein
LISKPIIWPTINLRGGGVPLLFFSFFILSSCTTIYDKGVPDFRKSGKGAIEEYEKHKVESISLEVVNFQDESIWAPTSLSSARPFMELISPDSMEKLDELKPQRNLNLALLAVLLGITVYEIDRYNQDEDHHIGPVFWGVAGIYLSQSLYLTYQYDQVRKSYNRDLRERFSPVVSWVMKF